MSEGAILFREVSERVLVFVVHGVNLDNVVACESGFHRFLRSMEGGPKSYVETMKIPNEVSFFEGYLCPLERSIAHEFVSVVE